MWSGPIRHAGLAAGSGCCGSSGVLGIASVAVMTCDADEVFGSRQDWEYEQDFIACIDGSLVASIRKTYG